MERLYKDLHQENDPDRRKTITNDLKSKVLAFFKFNLFSRQKKIIRFAIEKKKSSVAIAIV